MHMILGIYNAWKLEHDAEEFELQEMQGIVSITTSVLRICNVHTSVVKKLNHVCVCKYCEEWSVFMKQNILIVHSTFL